MYFYPKSFSGVVFVLEVIIHHHTNHKVLACGLAHSPSKNSHQEIAVSLR